MATLQSYCVKCKTKRDIANPVAVFTSTGSPATRGTCPVCGTTLFRMGATEAHTGLTKPVIPAAEKKTGSKAKTKSAAKKTAKSAASKKKSASSKTTGAKTTSTGSAATAKKASAAKTKPASKTAKSGSATPIRRSGKLVIVESPAKARSVGQYLGSGYTVKASKGHVRDLLVSQLSVDVENNFEPKYRVPNDKRDTVKDLKNAVDRAGEIFLATDPDREGEAIAWHLLAATDLDNGNGNSLPVQRVVFHEITKSAVQEAFRHPRELDLNLVNAQQARRILDRLVGYNITELLWEKVRNRLSAGRVQSIATRLIVDREREIQAFAPVEYWTLDARLRKMARNGKDDQSPFLARLVKIDGQEVAFGKEGDVQPHLAVLERSRYTVVEVKKGERQRKPSAPFTTSTLQQEASRRFGMNARRTMSIAQQLYEGIEIGQEGSVGLISYMRTDSTNVSAQAQVEARDYILNRFGKDYAPSTPPQYRTRAKGAQEAHEAIRPTDISRSPRQIAQYLDDDQKKLYELIWRRTIASQMASAELERTVVTIHAASGSQQASLRANGQVIKFDGFLAAYEVKLEEEDEEGGRLPELKEGEQPRREKIEAKQHHTEPPARFSEASLIKRMEELGIGRPSTYAATLSTLQDREYVTLDKRRFIPQSKGRLVTSFLESFFRTYVEYDFTAELEEKLDRVSAGELAWKDVLRDFWKQFSGSVDEIKDLRVTQVLDMLNVELAPLAFPTREDGSNPRVCPTCGDGQLSLKIGKFGAFVGCSNYPECNFTRQLGAEGGEGDAANDGPKILGKDPATSEDVSLRSGRFGPYVQRGDGKEPTRASIPKGWKPDEIDLESALRLLTLPRHVGNHPETGKPISAGIGRYGPFVLHNGVYANLDSADEVFTVGLNRAVSALAEKAEKGGRSRTPSALKELGEHPQLGGPVTVRDGKYGAYVNHGKVNATLPKGTEPQSVTLEEAVSLVAAKFGQNGPAKGKPVKAVKKPAAKKAPAKKPAVKKAAGKTAVSKKA